MAYAAYLRIYEPVSAFHEPDRSRWAAYADSATRPRRPDMLAAEHADALRRVIAEPPVAVPEEESEHAYVRRVDGLAYVCPWETQLRSRLAWGLLQEHARPGSERSGGPVPEQADAASPERLTRRVPGRTARPHIKTSAWTVPLAWFFPFEGAERWVALGHEPVQRAVDLRSAAAVRALVYATPMAQARKRVARRLRVLRQTQDTVQRQQTGILEEPGVLGENGVLGEEAPLSTAEVAGVGRWLEQFHPCSLVELDYGGLVGLFSDDALCGDESVAEIAAAIDAIAGNQREVALAMYSRVRARWRAFYEFELVN
jgi:hypothetical protein